MHSDSSIVVAIVAAAGTGKRIGGDCPKQYLTIASKPILIHTLEKFDRCCAVDEMILVTEKARINHARNLLKEWGITKTVQIVEGGAERQDSIRHALDALPEQAEWVIVHDGVRPFVSAGKIEEAVQAGRDFGAAVLAVPEKNTVKKVKDNWVEKTLQRNKIWEIQTPQVFKTAWLKASYDHALRNRICSTDDAALVEQAGYRVRIVEGEETNLKITSPADLIFARSLIEKGY